jgi:hypothetical protein
MKITRAQTTGLVCYAELTSEAETTLVWYDPQTQKGEVYAIVFEDDAISIEKNDITPSVKFDFSDFDKITSETFDTLASEINDTIAEAEIVEEV